jgi:GNAT superfamily N-acetyltransferase
MAAIELRRARRADLPGIVDIWVDAFTRDPYLRWIEPDDAAWPRFATAWLTFVVEQTFERGHTYLSRTDEVAVAWVPPDVHFGGPDVIEQVHGIVAAHAGEARADDVLATLLPAHEHTLTEPHWTLQYLGARSRVQGRGAGAAAVAPMLAECEADGLPCGLISTNARNVSFYERHGFRVVAEVATPDGAAVLRPMHRAAHPEESS